MDDRLIWTLGATTDLQFIYAELDELEGEGFLRRLDAALTLLRVFPEQAPVFSGKQRRLLVGKNRRYGLFYAVENRGIVISALADLRQDPKRIASTLRSRSGGEQEG